MKSIFVLFFAPLMLFAMEEKKASKKELSFERKLCSIYENPTLNPSIKHLNNQQKTFIDIFRKEIKEGDIPLTEEFEEFRKKSFLSDHYIDLRPIYREVMEIIEEALRKVDRGIDTRKIITDYVDGRYKRKAIFTDLSVENKEIFSSAFKEIKDFKEKNNVSSDMDTFFLQGFIKNNIIFIDKKRSFEKSLFRDLIGEQRKTFDLHYHVFYGLTQDEKKQEMRRIQYLLEDFQENLLDSSGRNSNLYKQYSFLHQKRYLYIQALQYELILQRTLYFKPQFISDFTSKPIFLCFDNKDKNGNTFCSEADFFKEIRSFIAIIKSYFKEYECSLEKDFREELNYRERAKLGMRFFRIIEDSLCLFYLKDYLYSEDSCLDGFLRLCDQSFGESEYKGLTDYLFYKNPLLGEASPEKDLTKEPLGNFKTMINTVIDFFLVFSFSNSYLEEKWLYNARSNFLKVLKLLHPSESENFTKRLVCLVHEGRYRSRYFREQESSFARSSSEEDSSF